MPIRRGSNLVTRVFRGSTEITRVFRGSVELWRKDPVIQQFDSGSSSVTAPTYAAFLDVGVVGGGASGATGDNGISTARGTGAPAAVWASTTIPVKPGETYNYTVGTGGLARNGVKVAGQNGTASTVTGPSGTVVNSNGSTGPAANTSDNNTTGYGTAASSIAGMALPGASNVGEATAGNPPGSGGGGGPNIPWTNNGSGYYSGAGAPGRVLFRWRSF